jgi:hypothetical protein
VTRRLRRFLSSLAALAIVVFLAAACSSDGFPVSYEDQVDAESGLSNVELNWTEGCVPSLSEDLADKAEQVCQCSFSQIKASIPFDAFVEANSRLRDNPEILEELESSNNVTEAQIVEIVKGCIAAA